MLRIRNILNFLFIILALVAMVGIGIYKFAENNPEAALKFYYVGLAAVIIKMVEALFRIPDMTKKTKYQQRREDRKNEKN